MSGEKGTENVAPSRIEDIASNLELLCNFDFYSLALFESCFLYLFLRNIAILLTISCAKVYNLEKLYIDLNHV